MNEQLYPCEKCGKLRTKDEGGTTFSLCDECWEKYYGEPKGSEDKMSLILTDEEIKHIFELDDIPYLNLTEYKMVCEAQLSKFASMDDGKVREFLVDYMTSYKDVSERHALAETPVESAEYLVSKILPLISAREEKVKIDARKEVVEKIKNILSQKMVSDGVVRNEISKLVKSLEGEK